MRVRTLLYPALLAAGMAHAGVIVSPIAAPVNTAGEYGAEDPIDNTFNQMGLSSTFTSGVTDFASYIAGNPQKNYVYTNEWFSAQGVTSGTVVYDLGQNYNLSQLAFWQEDASGIATMGVYACSTSACSDASLLGSFSPAANPVDQNYGPDIFNLSAASTEFVEFQLTGPGPNGQYDGLAIGEVAFNANAAPVTTTPEPGSIFLLGSGLLGTTVFTRRRRSVA